jgi:hypothetical protein
MKSEKGMGGDEISQEIKDGKYKGSENRGKR